MSLDIDWSLLSTPGASSSTHPFPSPSPSRSSSSSSSLHTFSSPDPALSSDPFTSTLVHRLNALLSSTPLPPFIGPITITSFSFGSVGPSVEIKDIRDVWRAFEEGDEEGDDALLSEEERRRRMWREEEYHRRLLSPLDEEEYDLVSPLSPGQGAHGYGHGHEYEYEYDYDDGLDPPEDTGSVYSMASPRAPSVAAVGLGAQVLGSRSRSRAPSLFSQPMGGQAPPRPHQARRYLSSGSVPTQTYRSHAHAHAHPHTHAHAHAHSHGLHHAPSSRHGRPASASASHALGPYPSYLPSPPASPTPSPPPEAANSSSSSSLPSLQLHLRVTHASDLTLTLLTSLQVNYPSALFMSLPLKLSITGLTLNADVVLAYSGEKKRVHLCVVDEQDAEQDQRGSGAGGGGLYPDVHGHGGHGKPIGERLLPSLNIESEIGHADAHVLRNVGKVEKFIADVLRKLLVDELVFPNFHTIAL